MSDSENKKTLLIVDDEENIISSLKRVFHKEGYTILCANSAKEGLEILSEKEVGVIISDQRMPGMTGTEFFAIVKKQYPKIIRIILSGYTELKSITDAVNEGSVYRFFTKPWDDEQLKEHIRKAFADYELEKENERLSEALISVNKELESINVNLERRMDVSTREMMKYHEEHNLIREIVENIPAAVVVFKNNGRIKYFNKMAHDYFNMSGKTCDFVSDLPLHDNIIKDAEYHVTWKKEQNPGFGTEAVHIGTRKFNYNDKSTGIISLIIPER